MARGTEDSLLVVTAEEIFQTFKDHPIWTTFVSLFLAIAAAASIFALGRSFGIETVDGTTTTDIAPPTTEPPTTTSAAAPDDVAVADDAVLTLAVGSFGEVTGFETGATVQGELVGGSVAQPPAVENFYVQVWGPEKQECQWAVARRLEAGIIGMESDPDRHFLFVVEQIRDDEIDVHVFDVRGAIELDEPDEQGCVRLGVFGIDSPVPEWFTGDIAAPEVPDGPDEGDQITYVYSFEDGDQGWAVDTEACPDATLKVSTDKSFEGQSSLAWALPDNTLTKPGCVIGVATKQAPPEGLDPDTFDWTYTKVGCWVNVPTEMRDGTRQHGDVQLVVPWVLNDFNFGAYFGDDFVFGPDSEEWEFLSMIPGQQYLKFDGVPAERGAEDPFGELFSVKLRAESDEPITLSGPIYVDKCEITTGFPQD